MNRTNMVQLGSLAAAAIIGLVADGVLAQMVSDPASAPIGAVDTAPAAPAAAPETAAAPAPETPTAEASDTNAPALAVAAAEDNAVDMAALNSLRDPFWPIGWKPAPVSRTTKAAVTDPQGPIRWEEATRMLVLTSLVQLPQGGYVATLKSIGLVEAGDKISVNYGGLTYHWEVRSITEKGIVPRRLGVTAQRGS